MATRLPGHRVIHVSKTDRKTKAEPAAVRYSNMRESPDMRAAAALQLGLLPCATRWKHAAATAFTCDACAGRTAFAIIAPSLVCRSPASFAPQAITGEAA